jgi:PASTA domain/FG-GAP-like repeat
MDQIVARARKRSSFGAAGSAAFLACVGVALTLGVVASSAPAPALSFAEPKEYAVADGPDELVSGDLNGDGKLDLVTANGTSISVLLNRGDGSFQVHRDYRAPGFHLAVGDLNGDGSRELAAADVSGNGVSVFVNKGKGSFLPRRDYRTGREPWSVAIADLTGDGKRDVATANSVANSVSVLANTTGLCTVPKVTGMTLVAARSATARAGCHVGKIRRGHSKTVNRGRVISQKPKFGTVLPNGGKVDLVVSLGQKS